MRLAGLLIALAIVGWLVSQQLGKTTDPDARQQAVDARSGQVEPPSVPVTVQQVPQFDQDMNQYMDSAADQRAKQLEEQTQ